MSAFDHVWLRLREPADGAARAKPLEGLLATALADRSVLHIVDLGSGTGSNLRYLAPVLGGAQHWRLVDADPRLLARVPARVREWADAWSAEVAGTAETLSVRAGAFSLSIARHEADLAKQPLPARDTDTDLVTAAALLDLVSHDWIGRLAASCATAGAAVLTVLSYDGRIAWTPSDRLDPEIRTLVNRHQTRDKGFGGALGPDAHVAAASAFAAHGYRVHEAVSDWRLTPAHAELQQRLHAGWAAAASEAAPHRAEAVQGWLARRMDLLAAGTSEVIVGHMDLLALPPA